MMRPKEIRLANLLCPGARMLQNPSTKNVLLFFQFELKLKSRSIVALTTVR